MPSKLSARFLVFSQSGDANSHTCCYDMKTKQKTQCLNEELRTRASRQRGQKLNSAVGNGSKSYLIAVRCRI